MKVNIIVMDIDVHDVNLAMQFYQEILGLNLLMDHGWIKTFSSDEEQQVQLNFAKDGESGGYSGIVQNIHSQFNTLMLWQQLSFYWASFGLLLLAASICLAAIC